MAGLYIHIPFCKSRCTYCGFYSTTLLELRQRYVDAVCREMEANHSPLTANHSIYLGGGTPSQLTTQQLEQLFLYINKVYQLPSMQEGVEVTIECNPDDVTSTYASALPQLGINRVSMGAQTFNDERLRFLNRRHTADQVPQAVERLRQAGIRNISIDLMYGFPQESLADWERDIDAALALGVEHLSAYCLMYEEGTLLYRLLQQGSILEVDEETERQMYELLMDKLQAAGYEHYEISNWSLTPRTQPSERELKSYRSQHNSNYWRDVPYIGLGAAAHSYDGQRRSWNVADVNEYILRVENGLSPIEDSELIEGWTRYNDRITVALRTCEGLDLTTLTDEQRDYCIKNARRFLDDGLLVEKDHHLVLTRSGLFVSDMVMSELMKV
jgi:oxygen-independent coproporphyrinogen-3 oxidase